MTQDIRWKQRFSNYKKALARLSDAVYLSEQRGLSELEKQGLIQAFEYTHELAWKVMQDFFIYQGNTEIRGSRDATREAFKYGLIKDGETWIDMVLKRNMTSHTYNESTAEEIYKKITQSFHLLFIEFEKQMESIAQKSEEK